MINKLNISKKHINYGIFIIIIGATLFLAFSLISNGGVILNGIGNIIAHFLNVISPIIYAFIISYILYYPVIKIEGLILKIVGDKNRDKFRVGARVISILLMIIILILVTIGLINFIIPPLVNNIDSLLSSLPQYEQRINTMIWELNDYLASLSIDADTTTGFVSQIKLLVGNIAERALGLISSTIGSTAGFIVDFIVTVILAVYFLKDKEKIFDALNKFGVIVFSEKVRRNIKIFISDLDNIVGQFLLGEILDSIIVGIVSALLMFFIGNPFAVLIGLVAGITNIIPYVGPIVGAVLAFFLGSFTSLKMGIWGFVLLILYQQVDGNFVQPKIVGDKVGLSPVWILIAVLIGGSYLGPLGMIVGVPIAALVAVYIDRRYKQIVERRKGTVNEK